MVRLVIQVDLGNASFQKNLKKIPKNYWPEVLDRILLLKGLDLDKAPDKLHFHQLKNKEVRSRLDQNSKVSVWTIHISADDKYKASFTLEGNPLTAYMRTCGEHDSIDSAP